MSSEPPQDRSDVRGQSHRFVTGRLVAGRYELLDRIGEGGTAEVFRARDHRLDRVVAVKVLRPHFGQDPDARARFAAEARSAAALAVPNIVPVYDFGAADDGSLFIVMRFIDGPSLRGVLVERGSLPSVEAVDAGRQVAQALAAAHGHGLVHRDVTPGNILLDAAGTAHLTDFGIVKALGGGDDLTRSGTIFGTAAYLSPEQAVGGPVGPRTDLYALGVVLYEALAGQPPFRGDDALAVSYRHANETPTPLAVLLPGVHPDLDQLVMQSLEKDPQRRPADAAEVAERLRTIHGGLTSTAPGASLGGVAAAVGAPTTAGPASREPEQTTVMMTEARHDAATGVLVTPVTPAARPAAEASMTLAARPAHAGGIAMGTAPPPRSVRASRARRRAGAATGFAVGLLALALFAVGGLLASMLLLNRDDGAVGDASASATPAPTFAPTVPPIALPTLSAIEFPTPAPLPTAQPTPPPTAEPTATPEPEPTAPPTTEPPPPVENVSVRIPNRLFEGDYDGRGSGRYHGRSASWVYGQGTPYHTMTAQFQLTHDGEIRRRASLEIVGLDGDNPRKNRISISLNGVTIYEGPNPLPNDECCGPSGPGNWGSAVFDVPGEILRPNNTLAIANLESGDCTLCPTFVMVDYAVLEYRVRP